MPLVRELTLRNFRSYEGASVRLEKPGLHLLWGGNGEGKTSVLEALYFAAFLRSFRTGLLADLVRDASDCCEVGVSLADSAEASSSDRLYVRMGSGKTLRRNGHTINRASEFINGFVCIALVPEDIELISGAPGRRRQFMDMLLTQLDGRHLAHLSAYREALRSRNALFRRNTDADRSSATAFAAVMARHGAAITRARKALCGHINEALAQAGERASGDESSYALGVEYKANCALQSESADDCYMELQAEIERHWQRDVRQGCTSTGPHRDDLAVRFNGRSVTSYGSQGERRISGILLKLASLQLVHRVYSGRRPIVLLIDDVLGDLDSARRRAFLASVSGADQVLLVQTEAPDEALLPQAPAAIHHVVDGVVTSQL